ncbi:MAG: hypothetical protein ABI665_09335 [Vicinamibacterales bacterium]
MAIDPGYRESAFLLYDGTRILEHGIKDNEALLLGLQTWSSGAIIKAVLVIEEMQIFAGHGVGKEVFDSVFWSGRFAQAWTPRPFDRLLRSRVRAHLGASRGGDAAVRQSLIERFGPYKEDAIGTKLKRGPLYGITKHSWSALAIAVTYCDQNPVRSAVQPVPRMERSL